MRNFLTTVAFVTTFPVAAMADPTLGLGLTFKFGADGVDPGVALRIFSDNRRNSFVGSLGMDYLFRSRTFRPTVGGSFLGQNSFFGLDLGLGSGFGSGGLNYGFSGGQTQTEDPAAAPVTPPPVLPPPANSTFLEEENMDIIIGGATDFA